VERVLAAGNYLARALIHLLGADGTGGCGGHLWTARVEKRVSMQTNVAFDEKKYFFSLL